MMISPTGKGIRNDKLGQGHYGASRGSRKHKGLDFECQPGQIVVSPIDGTVLREARPYGHSIFSGLLIAGKDMALKLFYLIPTGSLIGHDVKQGEAIGIAQDISSMYGSDMDSHIHLSIVSANPRLFMEDG